jgi:shikimate dehydrogenase
MFPDIGVSAVDVNCFKSLESVVDVVYNPLRSKLVCDSLEKGVKAVGGLLMLVAQAAFAAEKFVGKSVSDEKINSVYEKIFNKKQNVVLIGMPGCGKTSTGKIIAEKLGFGFVDTDEEVYKTTGKFAYEIIEEKAKKNFATLKVML